MSEQRENQVIPIISEASSPAEMLAYIRILEARLECDAVYVAEPGEEEAQRVVLDQMKRVEMILSDLDGIGCRDETIALLERDLERANEERARISLALECIAGSDSAPQDLRIMAREVLSGDASRLQPFLEKVLGQGWRDGYGAARDDAAFSRILIDGVEPSGFALARSTILAALGATLARIDGAAEPVSPAISELRENMRRAASKRSPEEDGEMSP
jgi:hypothetical protein